MEEARCSYWGRVTSLHRSPGTNLSVNKLRDGDQSRCQVGRSSKSAETGERAHLFKMVHFETVARF